MAILTIARELGAITGGEELVLCNTLNLYCINKATLEAKFLEMGVERSLLERFDESKPGITDLFNSSANIYWETLQVILLKELLKENVAIIGRGGNFLLSNLVNCFRLRLTAPLEYRVRQLCIERDCSENDAIKAIRQSDSAREKFCRYYYSADWRNPLAYDMVINTAEIPMEKVAAILPELLPKSEEGVNKEQLQCAVQEQIIRHALFSAWNNHPVNFAIKCQPDGTVTLLGGVRSREAADFAQEIVSNIPGVTNVKNELYVIVMDPGMPIV